jgi:hypothetical protein
LHNDVVRIRIRLVASIVVLAAILAVVLRPPISEPALAHELIAMEREANKPIIEDGFRGIATIDAGDARLEEYNRLQAKRAARLKEIIDQYGWPTNKMVGREGVHSAVRQLDRIQDPQYVASVLPLVLKSGDHSSEVAYLVDIVAVQLGQLQTFGTQWTCRDGLPVTEVEVKDPANVDARRRQYGLPPFNFDVEGREGMCTDSVEQQPPASYIIERKQQQSR